MSKEGKDYSSYIAKIEFDFRLGIKKDKNIWHYNNFHREFLCLKDADCQFQLQNKNKNLILYVSNIKKYDITKAKELGKFLDKLSNCDYHNSCYFFETPFVKNYNEKVIDCTEFPLISETCDSDIKSKIYSIYIINSNTLKIVFKKKHLQRIKIKFVNDDNINNNGQYQSLVLQKKNINHWFKNGEMISHNIWKKVLPFYSINNLHNPWSNNDSIIHCPARCPLIAYEIDGYDLCGLKPAELSVQNRLIHYYEYKNHVIELNYDKDCNNNNIEVEDELYGKKYNISFLEVQRLTTKYSIVDANILFEYLRKRDKEEKKSLNVITYDLNEVQK